MVYRDTGYRYIPSFYTALLCQSFYFFSLMWPMVEPFSSLLLFCHCFQFVLKLEQCILPGKGRHCTCAGKGHEGGGLPVRMHEND